MVQKVAVKVMSSRMGFAVNWYLFESENDNADKAVKGGGWGPPFFSLPKIQWVSTTLPLRLLGYGKPLSLLYPAAAQQNRLMRRLSCHICLKQEL